MAKLGLLPPYTEMDLKQAYLVKAKITHPDRGGSAAAFHELQTAYEHAMHYVHLRKDRRAWIASQIDAYLELQALADALARDYSAEIHWDRPEWIEQSFGDFAQLIDKIVWIRLENSPAADLLIEKLVRHESVLQHLQRLDLSGSRVSDGAVLRLSAFPALSYLDLRGTPVTDQIVTLVDRLPNLQALELAGTHVSWWSRRRVRIELRRRDRVAGAKHAFSLLGARSSRRPQFSGP